MKPNCAVCIHLMQPHQTVDNTRRCRRYGLEVSEPLEADCKAFVRETGSDDEMPPWYWGAWHVAGEGRGD